MRQFWQRQEGQDLIEYSLILGFIALLGAAGMLALGENISAIWSVVNHRLGETTSSS